MTLMSKGERKWEIFANFCGLFRKPELYNKNRFKCKQQEKFVGFSCIESKF